MKTIYCHPHHKATLQKVFRPEDSFIPLPYLYAGVPIRFIEAMPMWVKRWVFPKEHGWIYEPNDEQLCRFFGWGREEETTEPFFAVVDESFLYKPTIQPWMLTA